MGNKNGKKKEETKKEEPKKEEPKKEEPKKEEPKKEEPKKEEPKEPTQEKYMEMLNLFLSDPLWASTLTNASGASVHDKLAGALVNLSNVVGKGVSLQATLLELEFEQKKDQANNILKAGSIVAKMLGKYPRKVADGDEFLRTLLTDLILEVTSSSDKLECNPAFLKVDNPDEEAAQNAKKLESWCQKFADRIFDEKFIEKTPRELRAICYYIESCGEKNGIKDIYPLVNGLILMRYICNGISGPNNYAIIKDAPNDEIRGNLTYIAKVFQKLSNLETFGDDTKHLIPLNDFLEKNKESCIDYLKKLTKDPNGKDFEDLKKPEEKTVSFGDFPIDDVKFVWKVMKDNNKKFIKELSPENGQVVSKLLDL